MDIKLNELQVQLQDTSKKFMEKECTMQFVREMEKSELGYSSKMWQQMADMGWLGLPLPEDCGGMGMSTVDLVILMKELGRKICPSPYFPTVVIGGEAIAKAGSDAQKEELIPKIVAGETILSFAYQEMTRSFESGAIKTEARADGDNFVLNGTKMFVEFAAAADAHLVVARTSGCAPVKEGLTMFLVDANTPGIECIHLPTIARDHHYQLNFNNVKVPKSAVLGKIDDAWSDLEGVIDKGALAWSAFTVGASLELHEQSTQYAKDRVQFGRPIGQMQVIQGYLAQLIMEIYAADTMALFTAFQMDKGRHVRGYVAKTKVFSGESVSTTMDVGSQIFGGMGYMEDMDTTLYLRRGKQYQLMFGGLDYWYDIIAEELIDVENPVVLA